MINHLTQSINGYLIKSDDKKHVRAKLIRHNKLRMASAIFPVVICV